MSVTARLAPMDTSPLSTSPGDEDLSAFRGLQIHQDAPPPCQFLQPSPQISSSRLRPEIQQHSSEPYPSATLQLPHLQAKPRPRSPFARGHLRSHSAYAGAAPPMARTKSLPIVATSNANPLMSSPSNSPARPSSPLRVPPSIRSSSRRSFEELRPAMAAPVFTEIESIAEDSELDLSQPRDNQASPLPAFSAAFSRSNSGRGRRRPTSPLHQQQAPLIESPLSSRSSSVHSARFNEPHPFSVSSAGSSIPSTPTSFRSRSPSISSLETIADSPDAEEEAAEDYHIAKLKAAAEAVDAAEAEAETQRKLRDIGLVAPATGSVNGAWSPQRLKEKRKRWSVCGAERRGDFEMETIWED